MVESMTGNLRTINPWVFPVLFGNNGKWTLKNSLKIIEGNDY